MKRVVVLGGLLAAVVGASTANAVDVCTYNVRFALGVFCPIHGGSPVCLSETTAIGPCDANIRCFGGPGFNCQADLEPKRGPDRQCPLGSVRPRGLICYKPITVGTVATPTRTLPVETATFTPTATAIPTGTASATVTSAATATRTAEPTETAEATETPEATETAEATGTPTGTAAAVIGGHIVHSPWWW
jgi:hypothetical protein